MKRKDKFNNEKAGEKSSCSFNDVFYVTLWYNRNQ